MARARPSLPSHPLRVGPAGRRSGVVVEVVCGRHSVIGRAGKGCAVDTKCLASDCCTQVVPATTALTFFTVFFATTVITLQPALALATFVPRLIANIAFYTTLLARFSIH